MSNRPYFQRWAIFIKERFPLPTHLFMGFFLGLAGFFSLSQGGIQTLAQDLPWFLLKVVCAALAYTFFLLRLRIMDEIKDYASDVNVHPQRPLARGLISLSNAKRTAVILAVLELLLTAFWSPWAWAAWLATALFTLLMYKEFFIGAFLEKNLFLYALVHSPSAALGALWMGMIATASPISWNWEAFSAYAAVLCLCALIYDISRKSWEKGEDLDNRSSYTRSSGLPFWRLVVTLLVLVSALLMELFLFYRGASSFLLWAWPALALPCMLLTAWPAKASLLRTSGLLWTLVIQLPIYGGLWL